MTTETTPDLERRLLALPRVVFEYFATTPIVPNPHQDPGFMSYSAAFDQMGLGLEEADGHASVSLFADAMEASSLSGNSLVDVTVGPEFISGLYCDEHGRQPVRQLQLSTRIDIDTRYAWGPEDIAQLPAQLEIAAGVIRYTLELVANLASDLPSQLPFVCPEGPHLYVP